MMAIKVIIAEDHRIMREGLCALLATQQDIKVIGQAKNGLEVRPLVREHSPDVVVMDIAMPGLNGIEVARKILAESPEIKIVALSMLSQRRWVTAMLQAGALGYLLKSDCTVDELATCIRTVMRGKMHLSAGITKLLVTEYIHQIGKLKENGSRYSLLSDREREVFQLLVRALRQGKSPASSTSVVKPLKPTAAAL